MAAFLGPDPAGTRHAESLRHASLRDRRGRAGLRTDGERRAASGDPAHLPRELRARAGRAGRAEAARGKVDARRRVRRHGKLRALGAAAQSARRAGRHADRPSSPRPASAPIIPRRSSASRKPRPTPRPRSTIPRPTPCSSRRATIPTPRSTARALRAGKHVFCEKPLAIEAAGLEDAIAAARGAQGVLTVGFNRRFAPLLVEAKQALEPRSGPLMMIYRVNAGVLPSDSLDPARRGRRPHPRRGLPFRRQPHLSVRQPCRPRCRRLRRADKRTRSRPSCVLPMDRSARSSIPRSATPACPRNIWRRSPTGASFGSTTSPN